MSLRRPEGDAWVDGRRVPCEQVSVALSDPLVQGGFGLFETLAVSRGRLLDLRAHLDRLSGAVERLGLPAHGLESVAGVVRTAAGACAWEYAWLKVTLTGDGTVIVCSGPIDPATSENDATAILLPWRRNPRDPLSGLKTVSYAGNVVGLAEARRRGADEGLWLNTRGHLAEGCTSNLFVADGGRLFTPAVRDGILPGVVRAVVLRAARELGFTIHEGKLRLRRLERAREAFLTSSVRGVRPLIGFEGRPVGSGAPGGWTRRLGQRVAAIREKEAELLTRPGAT